jgi:signal peptidase I
MNLDFSVVFIVLALVTGGIWALDAWVLAPRRAAGRSGVESEDEAREPVLVEYARSFFPIILIVFLFRSFVYEPFRIPSSSMLPTLQIGDFILVNKFTYGLRMPVVGHTLVAIGEPRRGDVVVFRLPSEPSKHYIKRLVGLPGDRIVYRNKQLMINGEPISIEAAGRRRVANGLNALLSIERLGEAEHEVLILPQRREQPREFVVPEGRYFMMGDNRDNSKDSRYPEVGFVPERNIVGKAVRIWLTWPPVWSRVGNRID